MKRQIFIDEFEFDGEYILIWFILNREKYARFIKLNDDYLHKYFNSITLKTNNTKYDEWKEMYCDKGYLSDFLEHHFNSNRIPEPF